MSNSDWARPPRLNRFLFEDARRIAMGDKMKVEYRNIHHDDKPCEREIVIPDGWEACSFKQAIRDNGMSAVIGAWVKTELSCRSVSSLHIRPIKRIELEVGAWYEMVGSGINKCAFSPHHKPSFLLAGHYYQIDGTPEHRSSPHILRRVYVSESPVATEKPFRLSGPGWYTAQLGELYGDAICSFVKITKNMLPGYMNDGSPVLPELPRLTYRATPEQGRVLEGL